MKQFPFDKDREREGDTKLGVNTM